VNQLMAPGDTEYRQFGPLHIRIDRHHEGVSINVTNQPALDRSFTNLDEGRDYLALLRDEANKGTAIWAIEQLAGAWTSAAAIVDQAEQDMVTDINATMDAGQPAAVDVSDILAGMSPAGSWTALRQNTRRDYSRTRVSSKEPTAAELDRIRAHQGGIVTTAPGQPWTLLRAIVRRELGDIHEVHGRHVIASVRLNARGMALVEQGQEMAA
jgi:hypothetical protein